MPRFREAEKGGPLIHMAAGLTAESVSAVFWVPMEVLKQRMQVGGQMRGAAEVLRDLLRREGPRALFKGYALTVGVFGPYAMVYFVGYERFKLLWRSVLCLGHNF